MPISLKSNFTLCTVLERDALPHADAISRPQDEVQFRQPASPVWAYLLPVVAGLIIRILVGLVWLGGTDLNNDAADYFSEATKLASGTREATPFYWPPGTTYYLLGWFTLFGSTATVARVAMIVLSTAQIGVVTALTHEATRRRHLALVAGWVCALYPPAILLVAQPYSQHLAGLALATTALCGIKWLKTQPSSWLVPLGLSLGIGCLARPSMMSVLLITLCATYVIAASRRSSWSKRVMNAIAQCLVIGVTAGLVLTPTILHNARYGGGYSLSTNNERNFFLGNNPYTPWYKTSHFAQRTLDELPPEVRSYLKSHYNAPNRRAGMKAAALQHIFENPGLAALRTVNRARSFWGFDYLGTRAIQGTYDPSRVVSAVLLLAEAGGYFVVMVFALLGLIHCSGHVNRTSLIWYLALVAAYAGPYCLAFASGTYHFPVIGLLIPFTALGINGLWCAGWRATFGPARAWIVLLVFVAMQIEYGYFTLAAGITGSP